MLQYEWEWGMYFIGWLGIAYHLLIKYGISWVRYGSLRPRDIRKLKLGTATSVLAYTTMYLAMMAGYLDVFGVTLGYSYFTSIICGATASSSLQAVIKHFIKDSSEKSD